MSDESMEGGYVCLEFLITKCKVDHISLSLRGSHQLENTLQSMRNTSIIKTLIFNTII